MILDRPRGNFPSSSYPSSALIGKVVLSRSSSKKRPEESNTTLAIKQEVALRGLLDGTMAPGGTTSLVIILVISSTGESKYNALTSICQSLLSHC
jgi:hypothetical protein